MTTRGRTRRFVLRPMVVGSLLLHVLILAALILEVRPPPPLPSVEPADEVAMVFDSTSSAQPSTKSATPGPQPSVAAGNEAAPVIPPVPETAAPAPQTPPPATPPPAPAAPTPPAPPEALPVPEAVTPPAAVPPAVQAPPGPPPSVSLSQEDDAALPPLPKLPAFTMPPLQVPAAPSPPRPAPPRLAARPSARSPSGFPLPQDWSMNAAPSQRPPAFSSHGFDTSTTPLGGERDSVVNVGGAKPGASWMGLLHRWTQARLYYPEEAIRERQQGESVIYLKIDRSGRVLAATIQRSSRSAFLDGAWVDVFRNATVPPFTPDMTEPTTEVLYTLDYILRGG